MEKCTKYVIYVCSSQRYTVLIELSYSNSALKYADNEREVSGTAYMNEKLP